MLSTLSLKRSCMARVNEGSHSFTCHPHVYPRTDGICHACLYSQPQSSTALWLVLISRPAESRRLSWSGWVGNISRWFVRPKTVAIPVLTGRDVLWVQRRRRVRRASRRHLRPQSHHVSSAVTSIHQPAAYTRRSGMAKSRPTGAHGGDQGKQLGTRTVVISFGR